MSQRRRLILTGAALAPLLVLTLARLLGRLPWFDRLGGQSEIDFAGVPSASAYCSDCTRGVFSLAEGGVGPGVHGPGPQWTASVLMLAAVLLAAALAT